MKAIASISARMDRSDGHFPLTGLLFVPAVVFADERPTYKTLTSETPTQHTLEVENVSLCISLMAIAGRYKII